MIMPMIWLLLAPTITTLEQLLHECECELKLLDMAFNFKKSSWLHSMNTVTLCAQIDQLILWVTEIKYLSIHLEGLGCSNGHLLIQCS